MNPLFWALLVLFLFGALLRMDWVYYLAYVVGGVWLFSTWSVRRALTRLTMSRHLIDRAFVGQQIAVQVRLTNASRLPIPWLRMEERVPLDLKDLTDYRVAVGVAGRGSTEHIYTLLAKRRGYFPLGPISLRNGDLFGFAESTWEETDPPHLTVYPLIVPLHALGLPSRIPLGGRASTLRLFEDPARLSGVRTYAGGDSQRLIHWKASAHASELLVKKFQPAIGLNVMLLLDFATAAFEGRYQVATSEWAVTIAASLAAYVAGERLPVGLQINGRDAATQTPAAALPARTGQGQLMAILSNLARAELSDSAPACAQWLTPLLPSLEWGTTVLLVTPRVSDELLWVLHQACRRGSSVLLLHCAGQADSRLFQARAARLGIRMASSMWEKDLQAI